MQSVIRGTCFLLERRSGGFMPGVIPPHSLDLLVFHLCFLFVVWRPYGPGTLCVGWAHCSERAACTVASLSFLRTVSLSLGRYITKINY